MCHHRRPSGDPSADVEVYVQQVSSKYKDQFTAMLSDLRRHIAEKRIQIDQLEADVLALRDDITQSSKRLEVSQCMDRAKS